MSKKPYLIAEFLTLYALLPFAISYFRLHNYFLFILWGFAAICYLMLKRDADFDNRNFLRRESVTKKNILHIFAVFFLSTIVLTAYTYLYEPGKLFSFPLTKPYFWALIMVLYPVLSVYPQEIIYRAFFYHRYRNLFRSGNLMYILGALSFGYGHIIFGNHIAVGLCFLGGLLFGRTYKKNQSLLLVSIEHALYGCMIFTIGLGTYFYHGMVG